MFVSPSVELSETNFESEVIQRSREVPVLVDFWAPWCGPCRMLGPILEDIASTMHGKFVLAKANTEEQPGLGQRFSVTSIPAVKLFSKGEVIAEFVGAISGTQVRRFLEQNLPTKSDALVEQAWEHFATNEIREARALSIEALASDARHPGAHLLLARIALHDRDAQTVARHAQAVDPGTRERDAAEGLQDAIGFIEVAAKSGGVGAVRNRVAQDEGDVESRYALACELVLDQAWREALEQFLQVVQRDRKYRDDAGRRAMLTIFEILGHDHLLTDEFRRQLQIYT